MPPMRGSPSHAAIAGRRALLLLIAPLAMLVSLAIAAPVGADQITYACEGDICLIDPDNPEQHSRLTETDGAIATERSPAWSPDASLIAYNGNYTAFGGWDVWTLDPSKSADAQEATNISESPDRGVESLVRPAWSPDGTRIAYAERYISNAPPNLESEVYVSPFDGSVDPLAIGSTSNKSELTPTWSPDGSTIAFSREGFIWTAPANGSVTPKILTNSYGYQPAWSPDGQHIATVTFSNPEHIRITNADGSGYNELPQPAVEGPIDWSPDSSQVTFIGDEGASPQQVRVVPADGSGVGHIVAMPSGWIVPHHPTISPDGTRIAFDARPSSGDTHEQVLVGPADGSAAAVPLTKSSEHNEEPDWRPCEGCVPPPKPQNPSAGGGNGTGNTAGTKAKQPIKVRLVTLKKVYDGTRYMTPVSIDCNAQGGHPTGRVAEICAASGNAYSTVVSPQTAFRSLSNVFAKPKPKKILVAKGSVRVPEGQSKPLKMKVTTAGKKLLKPGKTLKVSIAVKVTRPGVKAKILTKTVKIKVPAKKGK